MKLDFKNVFRIFCQPILTPLQHNSEMPLRAKTCDKLHGCLKLLNTDQLENPHADFHIVSCKRTLQ